VMTPLCRSTRRGLPLQLLKTAPRRICLQRIVIT